ncbi:glutaminase A [Sphingomonas sp. 1P06PA]|uniref:glutaminase A n=1 Tax=Sphingomonas sp. 1P06PA TaxID=554121 RepID=UPI0039A732E0
MKLNDIVTDIALKIAARASEIEGAADAKEEGLDPGPFGIAIASPDGGVFTAGCADTSFPIQSIGKIFALELAMEAIGDKVFERVGREPSGDPFNSIIDLERNNGVPRNPFVNAGALAVVDVLLDRPGHARCKSVVSFVTDQLGRAPILDDDVLASEHEGGDLNRAMLNFMRHHGNLRCDPDEVLDAYVDQCAISLNCADLARAGLFLTRTRLTHDDEEASERAARVRKLLALMMTCGHYDGSGDFALRVGLPAKSGVGGGILAIVPEVASVAVWSSNLDQHGNSMLGVRALEMLASRTGWSVFGPPLDPSDRPRSHDVEHRGGADERG